MKKLFTIVSMLLITFIPACNKTKKETASPGIPADEHNVEKGQDAPPKDKDVVIYESAINPLAGIWIGKDEVGQDIKLSFQGLDTMIISVGAESVSGTYLADYSTHPPRLTVNFGDHGVVNTIFEVMSDLSLRFENNEPGEPIPTAFTEAAIVFTRTQ